MTTQYTSFDAHSPAASAPPYESVERDQVAKPDYSSPSYAAPGAYGYTPAAAQYQENMDSRKPPPNQFDHVALDVNNGLVGFNDQSVKKGFIRKVYGILSLQILFTCAMCAVFMLVLPVRDWTVRNTWMMWVFFAATIITLFPMHKYKKTYPANMICLVLFTMFQTYTVALVCAIYAAAGNADTVLLAWGLTCIIFVSLTVFTFQSKIDFSFMGGFLSCGLFILILWGIALSFLGWRTSLLYSLFGALLFCGYILYDTSNIIKRMGPDDYVPAAVELYLDVINLFLFILRILGAGRK